MVERVGSTSQGWDEAFCVWRVCRSLVVYVKHFRLVVTTARGFLFGITVLPLCLFVRIGAVLLLWNV